MSPLLARRLASFKSHRRGFYSLWCFLGLVVLVLLTPLIVNDKPYVVWTAERVYWPFFKQYADKDFGGFLPTKADFKDPDLLAFVKEKKGFMVWPPVPYGPSSINDSRLAPASPSLENFLGTDDQGRDVLTRLLYGLRSSLFFGCLLALVSIVLGLLAGGVQGYFGGVVDLLGQRFTELWSSFPVLFVLMVLSSFVMPGLGWLLVIMSLFSWMGLAAFVRAEFLRARTYDYVKAAQVLGVPAFRIVWRHVLPNALLATVTYIPFLLNHGISVLTSLDFLGFGLPLGTPSMGELINQAKNNLYAPWLAATAFLGLSLVLVLITFIGEALREAMGERSLPAQ